MTLQELIDRALSIATAGQDPSTSPFLNADAIAEDMLPQVFGTVAIRAASTRHLRHTLRRTKTVAVVSGTVVLPTDTLSAYITDSVLIDPADRTKRYTYLPWDALLGEPLDPRLGHYSIEGESRLWVVEPGEEYAGTGPTAAYLLTIPCVPEVPASANDTIAVSEEVADELVTELARQLTASQGAPTRR